MALKYMGIEVPLAAEAIYRLSRGDINAINAIPPVVVQWRPWGVGEWRKPPISSQLQRGEIFTVQLVHLWLVQEEMARSWPKTAERTASFETAKAFEQLRDDPAASFIAEISREQKVIPGGSLISSMSHVIVFGTLVEWKMVWN